PILSRIIQIFLHGVWSSEFFKKILPICHPLLTVSCNKKRNGHTVDFKIIVRKIEGNLSEEESIAFDQWYGESKTHREYYHQVEKNYRLAPENIDKQGGWLKIEERLKLRSEHKRKHSWRYGIAASMLMLVSLYFFLQDNPENKFESIAVETDGKMESDIEVGSNKAILTVEDGSENSLEKGSVLSLENLMSNGEELVYVNDGPASGIQKTEVRYNILTIPRGGEFYLQLSDSTKVWLNSDSRIRYPVTFTEGSERKVELLYGEAFFAVKTIHDPAAPAREHRFQVMTKGQKITVLGTEFNVKAYQNEEVMQSTLVEGSIELEFDGNKKRLKPNEQAVIRSGSPAIEVRSIDVYNEIAWRDGVFGFENETLEEIMNVLSRWYDVEMVFENQSIKDL